MEKAHIISHSVETVEGGSVMKENLYYVGIDIAADNFVASIYQSPKQPIITKEGFKTPSMDLPCSARGLRNKRLIQPTALPVWKQQAFIAKASLIIW